MNKISYSFLLFFILISSSYCYDYKYKKNILNSKVIKNMTFNNYNEILSDDKDCVVYLYI